MERWQNSVAVVTGASSGIGAAIAKDLANAGLIVVGLARRKELVDDLRGGLPEDVRARFHSVKCDVSDLKSVNEAFDWIDEHLGGVDILINNAGMHAPGPLLTHDVPTLEKVLQTNVMGVVYCTQRAFRSMKARDVNGHVVLINSVVGHSLFNPPGGILPDFNLYAPSKYALTAMTEILRQELRGFNTKIKITSVSPGLVDTEIVPKYLRSFVMLKPEDISSGVVYAIATPPHVQVHELTIKPVGETF